MMVFDCFTYLNEKEILDIRINELKPLNPIHILVESKHTFVGNERDIESHNYNNLFQHIVKDMPNNGNPWDNEAHQRNCIKDALLIHNPSDEDIIIISDVDEIPSCDSIIDFNTDGVISLIMDFYGCYLNLLACKQCWNHAKITKWKYLKDTNPQRIRHEINDGSISNAGWHFSWMGDIEKMMYKFKNFSHQEESVQKHANPEIIRNKIEKGQSIWDDSYWQFIGIDNMPKCVSENVDKYKHLIKIQ